MEDKRVTPEQILAEIGIDVEYMAQLDISSSVVRQIVEHQGRELS